MGKQINQLTSGIALSGSDVLEFEQFYSGNWNTHKLTLTDLSTYLGVVTNPSFTTVLSNGNSSFGYSPLINTGDKVNLGTSVQGSLYYSAGVNGLKLENNVSTDYLVLGNSFGTVLKANVGAIYSDGIGNENGINWNQSSNQIQMFNLNGNVFLQTSELYNYHDTKINFDSPIYSFSQLTASKVPYLNASKNLVSSSISPTELGYLSGASSNIQNQLNNLAIGIGGWKSAARVLSASNITISSPGSTIDGVTMATSDRVVLNGQSTGSQNGVYVWNGSAVPMTRATDCSTGDSSNTGVLGMVITIEEGTYADQFWVLTTNATITIGSTTLTYAKGSATTYTGSNGITLTGNNFTLDNSYFTGDVTSSGGVLTIGNSKVTNSMLAGSIAYSKLSLTGAVLNADLAGSIDKAKITNTAVTLSDTQTLTAKTLTTPILSSSTSTSAGSLGYDGLIFYGTSVASKTGYVPTKYFIRQHAAYTLLNQNTIQPLFNGSTNGRVNLPVGTYKFELYMYLTSMSATSGNSAFSFAGTASLTNFAMTTIGLDGAPLTSSGGYNGQVAVTNTFGASMQTAGAGTSQISLVKGSFEVSIAGTVIPSITLVTAAAAVSNIGNYIEIEPMGLDTVVSVGPWD